MPFTIGIDLGGSRIKAALLSETGKLVHRQMKTVATREDYGSILAQLAAVTDELTHATDGTPDGIGLGVAGLMDKHRRTVLASPNITALNGKSPAADLAERSGLRTVMDNDANLMAIGEGAFGAAKGCAHFIAITLGTGVGGAVFSNGMLIRGFSGGGGELGHIVINFRGPRCGCGSYGCLEAYVGQSGIRRYIARKHPMLKGFGLKRLNQLALEGDREAVDVFRYIGATLGIGLAGLVNVFNPECIGIGGGVAAAGELLFKPLEVELHRRAFEDYLNGLQVRKAELGDWAGVVGAGIVAQNA